MAQPKFEQLSELIAAILAGTGPKTPTEIREAISEFTEITPAEINGFMGLLNKRFPVIFDTARDTLVRDGEPLISQDGGGTELPKSDGKKLPTSGDSVVSPLPLAGTVEDRLAQIFGQSATRGGRGDIFRSFGAAQGGTNIQRSARQRGFDPLSAAFVINQAQNPAFDPNFVAPTDGLIGPSPQSFRDFIGTSPQRLDTEQFRTAFNQFAPLFQGGQLSELQEAQKEFLGNAGQNLATQFLASQVNPLFQGSIGRAVGRRFDAQRDTDPLGDPFGGFLTRQGFGGR